VQWKKRGKKMDGSLKNPFSLPGEIEDGNAALAACGWERGVGRPRSISVIQRPISGSRIGR
jgi:hypothetical protein